MKKILILEDDPNMATLYHKFLTKEGYQFKVATSVPEALESMLKPYDLYIVDLMINHSRDGGIALLRTGINPVIIITALELDGAFLENYHYLRKPVRLNELSKKIKEVLNGGCKA